MSEITEGAPVKFVVTHENGIGKVVSCASCARQNREWSWVVAGSQISSTTYFYLLDHAKKFHDATSVQVS